MIKYLGSKRRLLPVLGEIYSRSGAVTSIDLFTGTTRVAQEFKRRGSFVHTVDLATYSYVLSQCYIETDASAVNLRDLQDSVNHLNALPGAAGYFTETFCENARFFQPKNGARVDVIRDAIERDYRRSWLYPVLLTSLMEAADRVDSTTGVQMAYLKRWAARSEKDVQLRVPNLLPGTGRAYIGDALHLAPQLPECDIAYLDPPYNQHRYFTNYHIWETLIRWDAPESYGIAQKRVDSRSEETKTQFNQKREMPLALRRVVETVPANLLVISYNNESWVSAEDLKRFAECRGSVELLSFDSKRYVGAQIGIHNPKGERVGNVSHLRNLEYVVLAGEEKMVRSISKAIVDSTAN
jgi:adenine-specific DNA-methyltransferase